MNREEFIQRAAVVYRADGNGADEAETLARVLWDVRDAGSRHTPEEMAREDLGLYLVEDDEDQPN